VLVQSGFEEVLTVCCGGPERYRFNARMFLDGDHLTESVTGCAACKCSSIKSISRSPEMRRLQRQNPKEQVGYPLEWHQGQIQREQAPRPGPVDAKEEKQYAPETLAPGRTSARMWRCSPSSRLLGELLHEARLLLGGDC
jgi:hypothetical protein